jgi:hypothetical protein
MSNLTVNTLTRQEYRGKIYVKNIRRNLFWTKSNWKVGSGSEKIIPDQQHWPLVFFLYVCLKPDPLNTLNPDQAYPSKRKAFSNFFQKMMSITQPDPETEGQSISKTSDTKKSLKRRSKIIRFFHGKILCNGSTVEVIDKKYRFSFSKVLALP